jgi:hypothetical protein
VLTLNRYAKVAFIAVVVVSIALLVAGMPWGPG